MSAGTLGALFRNWLVLRQAEILAARGTMGGRKQTGSERISDEVIVAERAILAGEAETDGDSRAQVAILAYYAVHVPPYAN